MHLTGTSGALFKNHKIMRPKELCIVHHHPEDDQYEEFLDKYEEEWNEWYSYIKENTPLELSENHTPLDLVEISLKDNIDPLWIPLPPDRGNIDNWERDINKKKTELNL